MGVWSYDFVEVQTRDGRKLRLMTLIDEFTRSPPFGASPIPHRPRSTDRTQSPVAVSQKREYFKHPPETIGIFASELCEVGVWRPAANSKKPAISGSYAICDSTISSCRTAWLTSEDSNSHIPDWEKPFDMSAEFPQIYSESGVGDFCSYKLRTGPHPSQAFEVLQQL
jgi:hypothetical protein